MAFHTEGCAPCAQMAPVFTKAAKSLDGIVKFGHVAVQDGNQELAKMASLTKVSSCTRTCKQRRGHHWRQRLSLNAGVCCPVILPRAN